MISPFEILMTFGGLKSLLLLLLKSQLPNEDYENWLENDKITLSEVEKQKKSHLIKELESLKLRFRIDMMDPSALTNKTGMPLTPIEVVNLVQAHKNRIDKVRLMIQHKVSIVENYNKPTQTVFVIARSLWIDKNGKKYWKFAKNLGAKERVMVEGKVPTYKLEEACAEIDRMMMKQYKIDYPD